MPTLLRSLAKARLPAARSCIGQSCGCGKRGRVTRSTRSSTKDWCAISSLLRAPVTSTPDATYTADGGEKTTAVLKVVRGADKIARLHTGLARKW